MSFNLPAELWYHIFSYLRVEDLCRARAVCRIWWGLINCDHLWRPKLLERRITRDCITAETLSVANAKPLTNCEWADICFRYHETVIRNWASLQTKCTECPPSTEFVLIHMPYMLKTFDPYGVVEVQRMSNGDFAPWTRIPLPQDNEEGCYEPQMSSEDAFAVSKNGYTIIYKRREGAFRFETALAFTDSQSIVFCTDESEAPGFLRNSYGRSFRAFASCLAVTKDVVWIYENLISILVVWDYLKSEVKLRLELSSDPTIMFCPIEPPRVHSTDTHIFLILSDEVAIYSPHGQRRWLYKQKQTSSRNFCCDRFGCGFILKNNMMQRAVYYDMFKVSLITLEVVNPVSFTLDKTAGLAYCLCLRDGSVTIACASTQSGELLWESIVCPSSKVKSEHLDCCVEMSVILRKYIVIQGVNGQSENFISPGHVSVYSSSNGKMVWCHSFHPARVVHLSDNFIVTRDRYPRGGMRYKFEVHNFLLPDDNVSKPSVTI